MIEVRRANCNLFDNAIEQIAFLYRRENWQIISVDHITCHVAAGIIGWACVLIDSRILLLRLVYRGLRLICLVLMVRIRRRLLLLLVKLLCNLRATFFGSSLLKAHDSLTVCNVRLKVRSIHASFVTVLRNYINCPKIHSVHVLWWNIFIHYRARLFICGFTSFCWWPLLLLLHFLQHLRYVLIWRLHFIDNPWPISPYRTRILVEFSLTP